MANLFAFTNRPMPAEPRGGYQTVGVLLRVVGWIALVVLVLGTFGMLLGMLAAAVLGNWIASMPWMDWTPFGRSGFTVFLVLAILFGLIIFVVFTLAWMFWVSTAYEQWRSRNPAALTNVLVLGIVMAVFGVLSFTGDMQVFSVSSSDGDDHRGGVGLDPGGGVFGFLWLGMGVALAILSTRDDVRAAFGPSTPAPAAQGAIDGTHRLRDEAPPSDDERR